MPLLSQIRKFKNLNLNSLKLFKQFKFKFLNLNYYNAYVNNF